MSRIRALVIPPAWTDVWICPHANGHLQATGRDAKGRKQYRYHAQWSENRNRTKFDRMIAFGKALPALSKSVRRDLRRKGLPKDKVVAGVISILAQTRIRVGNEEYVRANNSYGLTTMRDRHANVKRSQVDFVFRGKSGRFHHVQLHDRKLAQLVRRCQDLPGQVLFQYQDDAGDAQPINSADINDYLRNAMNEDFTSKDLRTWIGTLEVARALHQTKKAGSKTAAKRAVVSAINAAAESLGNRPATCRKYYVHPAVVEAYLDGAPAELPCKSHDAPIVDVLSPALDGQRKALLRFLKRCSKKP